MTGERIVFDPKALKALLDDPDGGVARELKRRGLKVQAAARRSLRHMGTGRGYKHGNVIHIASAPGQPPATDTGRLMSGITEDLGRDDRGLVETITADTDYSLDLEVGTRFMEPRPFMRPALREGMR